MSQSIEHLFANNKTWSERMHSEDPEFFTRLVNQQSPEYLWIGCSDSRVPANQVIGLAPGEVFVHRNIANVVVPSDLNALSVIQYAVDALRVRHIIVVGHSNCGGVKAALNNLRVGLADNWLRHIQDVRNTHRAFLEQVPQERRVDALVELNVLEQARNVCRTTIVEDAWQRGQEVVIHGWVYGLHNGLLEDLRMTVAGIDDIEPAHARAVEAVHQRYLGDSTSD